MFCPGLDARAIRVGFFEPPRRTRFWKGRRRVYPPPICSDGVTRSRSTSGEVCITKKCFLCNRCAMENRKRRGRWQKSIPFGACEKNIEPLVMLVEVDARASRASDDEICRDVVIGSLCLAEMSRAKASHPARQNHGNKRCDHCKSGHSVRHRQSWLTTCFGERT